MFCQFRPTTSIWEEPSVAPSPSQRRLERLYSSRLNPLLALPGNVFLWKVFNHLVAGLGSSLPGLVNEVLQFRPCRSSTRRTKGHLLPEKHTMRTARGGTRDGQLHSLSVRLLETTAYYTLSANVCKVIEDSSGQAPKAVHSRLTRIWRFILNIYLCWTTHALVKLKVDAADLAHYHSST